MSSLLTSSSPPLVYEYILFPQTELNLNVEMFFKSGMRNINKKKNKKLKTILTQKLNWKIKWKHELIFKKEELIKPYYNATLYYYMSKLQLHQ